MSWNILADKISKTGKNFNLRFSWYHNHCSQWPSGNDLQLVQQLHCIQNHHWIWRLEVQDLSRHKLESSVPSKILKFRVWNDLRPLSVRFRSGSITYQCKQWNWKIRDCNMLSARLVTLYQLHRILPFQEHGRNLLLIHRQGYLLESRIKYYFLEISLFWTNLKVKMIGK